MTRIQYLRSKSVEVAACSQTFVLPFLADTQLQSYRFAIDYGDEEVTNETSLFLVASYDREQYKYQYAIYYQLQKNAKTSPRVINWLLTLDFEDTTIDVNGIITQRSNPQASSISNFLVLDEGGSVLQKDYFNRWVIPNDYEEGSKFTIRYDASYPAYPGLWVNTNPGDAFGNGFIDQAYTEGFGVSSFTINDHTGSDTQNIVFDFDDNWGIGNALTYLTFTRDNIKPVKIRITPYQLVNVDHSGGNFVFDVTYENIEKSQLRIDTEATWLDASWNSEEKMAVSIQTNEGLDSVPRTTSIKISGTNDDGIYGEGWVFISQIAMDIPYIGDAVETIEDYEGGIVPAIHTDYKGNVVGDTGTFTFFNTKDIDGDDIIEDFTITIDDEPTDFIKIEDIPDTRNSKIIAKDAYQYNYQSSEIVKYIVIEANLVTGQTVYYRIGILIEASPEHIISPIWKDIFFESPKNYFRFKEFNTGDLLYNGIIYPDASNKIKINDILLSYLNINKVPFLEDINKDNNFIEAVLEISDDSTFEAYDEARVYHLYWDYSYDYNINPENLNDFTPGYYGEYSGIDIDANFPNPIEYYDSRQYVFIHNNSSYKYQNESDSQVYGLSYETSERDTLVTIPKNTLRGSSYTFTVRPGNYDEILYHVNPKPGDDSDKNYTWKCGKLKCTKAKYAVYYLNSYGIWCWMLFEGKQLESIKSTLSKYQHNSPNNVSYNIQTGVYQNTIEESYNLTSIFLKDDQSKKLKDLYTSPLIYVHELETDNIYNVYLSTTSYDIKTFHNQGRKYYTHNIKLIKSLNKNIKL